MPTFIPVDRAFANLTGSRDLKLIRNRDLKNALAQYFSTSKLVELVQNTHEMELVQTFQPYVIEHMDFQAVFFQRVEDFPLLQVTTPKTIPGVYPLCDCDLNRSTQHIG